MEKSEEQRGTKICFCLFLGDFSIQKHYVVKSTSNEVTVHR